MALCSDGTKNRLTTFFVHLFCVRLFSSILNFMDGRKCSFRRNGWKCCRGIACCRFEVVFGENEIFDGLKFVLGCSYLASGKGLVESL